VSPYAIKVASCKALTLTLTPSAALEVTAFTRWTLSIAAQAIALTTQAIAVATQAIAIAASTRRSWRAA